MAATRVYVTQLDKGLDTNIASSMIDEKSAVDILNTKWNEGGIVTKRDGYEPWGDALTDPKGMGKLILPVAREKIVIDGVVAKKATTGAYTDISGATFSPLATYYQLPQIKNRMFIWNSIDPGTVYDGTSLTLS